MQSTKLARQVPPSVYEYGRKWRVSALGKRRTRKKCYINANRRGILPFKEKETTWSIAF